MKYERKSHKIVSSFIPSIMFKSPLLVSLHSDFDYTKCQNSMVISRKHIPYFSNNPNIEQSHHLVIFLTKLDFIFIIATVLFNLFL